MMPVTSTNVATKGLEAKAGSKPSRRKDRRPPIREQVEGLVTEIIHEGRLNGIRDAEELRRATTAAVKALRKEVLKFGSVDHAAHELGLSAGHYGNIERGESPINETAWRLMCCLARVDVGWRPGQQS